MATTGALLHGDVARHLNFSGQEHPVALQLGGSDPADLAQAHCARVAAQSEPDLVADCIKAMQDAVALPVTVKHRIGIARCRSRRRPRC